MSIPGRLRCSKLCTFRENSGNRRPPNDFSGHLSDNATVIFNRSPTLRPTRRLKGFCRAILVGNLGNKFLLFVPKSFHLLSYSGWPNYHYAFEVA